MNNNESTEERLEKTLFVVEATSFEVHTLWDKYCDESKRVRFEKQKWEQINPGYGIEVGEIDGRPCWISATWIKIDGYLVMFWYHSGQVSDSVQTEAWIDKHFSGTWDNGRKATCDAANFHLCVSAIREKEKMFKSALDNSHK